MEAKPEIHFVNENNFNVLVIQEKRPVLLMCMPRDDQFAGQVDILSQITAGFAGDLKIAVLEEPFIPLFKKKYRVAGTPTYLILQQGEEKGRLLGLAGKRALAALIADLRPSLTEGAGYSDYQPALK